MSDLLKLIRDLLAAKVPNNLIKDVIDAICEAEEGAKKQQQPYRLDIRPDDWKELRRQVWDLDGPNCTYCRAQVDFKFSCDHVVPVSKGGKSELSNLTVACKPCNSSKKDLLVTEWRGRRCQ